MTSDKYTVLIVDDTETARDTLEGLLYRDGYHLLLAEDGFQALEHLEAHQVDVALLDIMMPEMDGFELCEKIRADPRWVDLPIIMITALDDKDSKLYGLEVGADEFISKPFDSMELRIRLRTMAKMNRYRRRLMERERLTRVVEQSSDGYLMLDAQRQIIYANPQARLFLEVPLALDAPLQQDFFSLVQRLYSCQPPEAWQLNAPADLVGQSRYLIRAETTTTASLWLQLDVLEENCQAQEDYLLRLRDVTNSVLNHRIMWAFHEQVSHKLRTPLSHVTMSLQYLEKDFSHLAADEQQELIGVARQGANRLQSSVEDIFRYLDILTAHDPGQHYCPVDRLPPLVAELKQALALETVTIRLVDEAVLQEMVLPLSPHVMEMLLRELLKNAQKFHPDQSPTIEITVSLVDSNLQLQIMDDGVHLSPEQAAQVWTPYYQGDKYFTGEVVGMGLGLSMVASLVWGANGTVQVHNRPDKAGVVIQLSLPLAE